MTTFRMTVLGSGSVGLAIAATCACAGAEVTVLARGLAVRPLRQSGITVTGVTGEHHVAPQYLKVSDAEHPALEDVQDAILIMATKAYQVRRAVHCSR